MMSLGYRLGHSAPVRVVRRHSDVRLLLGAQLVSLSGDWVLGVGLAYSVYELTGSTLASAISLLAAVLPQVVVGPVAGVLVDRWDRRRTMIWANLAMAIGLLPLLVATDATSVWIIYVVLAFQSIGEVFFSPAEQALIPRLVDEAELPTVISLNGQASQLARLGGSALGGVAAATGGVPAVALLDMATFVVAAVLVARIRTSGAVLADPDPEAVIVGRFRAFHDSLTTGVKAVRNSPGLRAVLFFALITSLGEGIMGTLFAPFVKDVLNGDGRAYGAVTSSQAIGGILGAVVATAVVHRFSPVWVLGAGSVVFGLIDLAIFLYPTVFQAIWPALVGMCLVGLPGALISAGFLTVFQRGSHDAVRGRTFSLISLARTIALVVGSLTAGVLAERAGIVPVLAFQGVGYVVAGLGVLVMLHRLPMAEGPAQLRDGRGRRRSGHVEDRSGLT